MINCFCVSKERNQIFSDDGITVLRPRRKLYDIVLTKFVFAMAPSRQSLPIILSRNPKSTPIRIFYIIN